LNIGKGNSKGLFWEKAEKPMNRKKKINPFFNLK